MASNAGIAPDALKTHADAADPTVAFADAATFGEGLRHARERSGKSMAELAAETKVHRRFLTALEQGDWSSLPSRVFALGYVRAYASALALDEQLAVERFKRESPDTSVPLKAPIGIAFEDVRRHSPRIVAGIAVVAIAVIGWNVFQRISLRQTAHPSDIAVAPKSWASGDASDPQFALSAPMAAPPAAKFATICAVTSCGKGLTPCAQIPWLPAKTSACALAMRGRSVPCQAAMNSAISSSRPSEPGGLVRLSCRRAAAARASSSAEGRVSARPAIRARVSKRIISLSLEGRRRPG